MVVERHFRVEKAKIKPKNNIKAKQKSSRSNSRKKAKKVLKYQTKIFQGQTPSKKAKFDLFGLTQGQMTTPIPQLRVPVL